MKQLKKEEESMELLSAKECFEMTKKPQLEQCIREIQEAVTNGQTSVYIGGQERLHEETRKFLLDKGFDLSIHSYPGLNGDGVRQYFNKCIFNEQASGRIIKNEDV